MKEGGIIATSFTIYPGGGKWENGRENFKGVRKRMGGEGVEGGEGWWEGGRGSCPVAYYVIFKGVISDFSPRLMLFSQVTV